MTDLAVVSTGAANLASVLAAFDRLGMSAVVSNDGETIRDARRVVLPGVGAFAPVAEGLRASGLDRVLRERITAGRPTLAICLGLQLLADASDEGPDAVGLGILPLRVRRLPDTVVVPQLGWNWIEPDTGCTLVRSGAAYFANSFCFTEGADGWNAAWSDHGGPFVAAVERGPVLGCQFHPELSDSWGAALLETWLGGSSC